MREWEMETERERGVRDWEMETESEGDERVGDGD